MEKITLQTIQKDCNTITYVFSATKGLIKYFSGKSFIIEYPLDVSGVPEAVLAVPFVCNVLPIIWLTDSKLVLPELDKTFFECISNVKKGYEAMFPESKFLGEVSADSIIEVNYTAKGRACFFSGGLDATQTLVSHLDERPHLISIWGSDIRVDNEEGWNAVHDGISETALRFNLPDVVIRSSFREFDNEGALDRDFSSQLKDSWWHGVKHGLGLLGHAAPYAYAMGLSTAYIASSNCPSDGPVRCASHPSIDNYVEFASCRILHDGYQFSRQDKIQNVVDYCNTTNNRVNLHVCWETQTGKNCCYCEKCYRTMMGIVACGADPVRFGFEKAHESIPQMLDRLLIPKRISPFLAATQWIHIQRKMEKNKHCLKKSPFWSSIRALFKIDFMDIDSYKAPTGYRIRQKMAEHRFYQTLSKIKTKLTGR